MDEACIGSLLDAVARSVLHVLSQELVYTQRFLPTVHLYAKMLVQLLVVLIQQFRIGLYQFVALHRLQFSITTFCRDLFKVIFSLLSFFLIVIEATLLFLRENNFRFCITDVLIGTILSVAD